MGKFSWGHAGLVQVTGRGVGDIRGNTAANAQDLTSNSRGEREVRDTGVQHNGTPLYLPGTTAVTPSPTLSTMPAPSCPKTTGKASSDLPAKMVSSEWQTPVATILMRTSPTFGGATSTVSITRGLQASQATAARQEMGCQSLK